MCEMVSFTFATATSVATSNVNNKSFESRIPTSPQPSGDDSGSRLPFTTSDADDVARESASQRRVASLPDVVRQAENAAAVVASGIKSNVPVIVVTDVDGRESFPTDENDDNIGSEVSAAPPQDVEYNNVESDPESGVVANDESNPTADATRRHRRRRQEHPEMFVDDEASTSRSSSVDDDGAGSPPAIVISASAATRTFRENIDASTSTPNSVSSRLRTTAAEFRPRRSLTGSATAAVNATKRTAVKRSATDDGDDATAEASTPGGMTEDSGGRGGGGAARKMARMRNVQLMRFRGAIINCRLEALDELAAEPDFDVDATIPDSSGKTALHLACAKGHHKVVTWLLTRGADVAAQPEAIVTAADRGYEKCVWKLVEADADVNAVRRPDKRTAIYAACERGYRNIVRLLLTECPELDVNVRPLGGELPGVAAARAGHVDIVKILLDARADTSFATFDMHSTHTAVLNVVARLGFRLVWRVV